MAEELTAVDRLMHDLQTSVERFRKAAMQDMQTQYWTERRSIPREDHAQLEVSYQHQERLVQKICDAMRDYVQEGVTPMAEAVMARVPEWVRAQGQELRQGNEEKQLTPAPSMIEGAPTVRPVQLSWREQWRERHAITTPSRSTGYRRDMQHTVRQEHRHGPGY